MKRPIRRTPVRHVVLHALYSGDIYFDHETQTYHGPGHTELTPLADKALTLFLEHGMVGVTPSGKCTTTPGGTDMYDAWPRRTPEGVEFFIDTRESQAVSTLELPEARLMCSGLDGTPLYLVFKTKRGWVGAPGLRKGQVLTDEDVKDGIPYAPVPPMEGARIAVTIHGHYVVERSGIDDLPWVSLNGKAHYDDNEIVELTGCESIEVGVDRLLEVSQFFAAEEVAPFIEHGQLIEEELWIPGDGGPVSVTVRPGTRVWRTENVFYVLQPDQNRFQIMPRVRNT